MGGGYLNNRMWSSFSDRNGLDILPTREIGKSSKPKDMAQMVMPNQDHPDFPEHYRFSTVIQDIHLALPKRCVGYYESCGIGEPAPPPAPSPLSAVIPGRVDADEFSGSESGSYLKLAESLRIASDRLHETHASVLRAVQRTQEDVDQFRKQIDSVILEKVNESAKSFPDPKTEDEHILDYIAVAMDDLDTLFADTLSRVNGTAATVRDEAGAVGDVLAPPGGQTPADSTPPVEQQPGADTDVPGVPTSQPDDLGDLPDLGLGDLEDPSTSGSQRLEDLLQAALPNPATALPPPGLGSPMDSLVSPFANGMMSPFTSGLSPLSNSMQPGGLSSSPWSEPPRVPDARRSSEWDTPPRVQPVVESKPPAVAASPAAASATPAATSGTAATAPATAASSTTGGPPPTRVADAGGGVWYEFEPGGRKQYVSPLVAQALDAARGNKDGTNAQLAFKDTPAKWSNSKEMAPVGPDEAITGCVAMWETTSEPEMGAPEKSAPARAVAATTAILVVFRLAEGNTENVTADSLEVIVDGELIPYTDDLAGKVGGFGDFAGFGRPRGIEPAGGALAEAAPTQPTPGEPGTVDTLIAAGTVSGG
ncbi:hypothetical protein [Nocardia brasiliensis]|uniref:hypothetical protein n=1 Tax=Nocardia brasiliensis TaxID=37326 RepID=UPI0024556495|nr:hypothetical protein [Nocardia brasiliensis]